MKHVIYKLKILAILIFCAIGLNAQSCLPARVATDDELKNEKKEFSKEFLDANIVTNTFVHKLGKVTKKQIEDADKAAELKYGTDQSRPMRIGIVRQFGNGEIDLNDENFKKVTQPNNKTHWLTSVTSPDAHAIRLHFENFDAKTYSISILSKFESTFKTYATYTKKDVNADNSLWTGSVSGDEVIIIVEAEEDTGLILQDILHTDVDIWGNSGSQGLLLPCEEDVMCHSVNVTARDAVGRMFYVSGGGGFVCTGTLLNDFDNDTAVPYFLTAFHCLSTQSEVNTLEVVWFYQKDGCNGTLPAFSSLPKNIGGTLLATSSTDAGNDMTFIRLNGALPGGISLAGWTTGGLPSTFDGIHHPGGGWKRYTRMHEENNGTCGGLPTSQYHYCEVDLGITEGGSSGSGIFNASGQLMGQLFGICYSDDVNCDASPEVYNNVYGKFSQTYPLIRQWLEVGGTICVDASYSGVELGTPTNPFNTVNEAINFAWDGARIKIVSGTYPEYVLTDKELFIYGASGSVLIN